MALVLQACFCRLLLSGRISNLMAVMKTLMQNDLEGEDLFLDHQSNKEGSPAFWVFHIPSHAVSVLCAPSTEEKNGLLPIALGCAKH